MEDTDQEVEVNKLLREECKCADEEVKEEDMQDVPFKLVQVERHEKRDVPFEELPFCQAANVYFTCRDFHPVMNGSSSYPPEFMIGVSSPPSPASAAGLEGVLRAHASFG